MLAELAGLKLTMAALAAAKPLVAAGLKSAVDAKIAGAVTKAIMECAIEHKAKEKRK